MTIREIARILDARWLCCEEDADSEVRFAAARNPTRTPCSGLS